MGGVSCKKSNVGKSNTISRSHAAKGKDGHTSAYALFPTSYQALWW